MSKTDRSCVIHLAEAQASIPGPAGEHAIEGRLSDIQGISRSSGRGQHWLTEAYRLAHLPSYVWDDVIQGNLAAWIALYRI